MKAHSFWLILLSIVMLAACGVENTQSPQTVEPTQQTTQVTTPPVAEVSDYIPPSFGGSNATGASSTQSTLTLCDYLLVTDAFIYGEITNVEWVSSPSTASRWGISEDQCSGIDPALRISIKPEAVIANTDVEIGDEVHLHINIATAIKMAPRPWPVFDEVSKRVKPGDNVEWIFPEDHTSEFPLNPLLTHRRVGIFAVQLQSDKTVWWNMHRHFWIPQDPRSLGDYQWAGDLKSIADIQAQTDFCKESQYTSSALEAIRRTIEKPETGENSAFAICYTY